MQIEVDVHFGLPQVQIVGLPDTAVRESRERVRAAIKNCGFDLPPRSVIVNLAPADLRKEGNHLDLGIATALLVAHGHLPQEALGGRVFCGELTKHERDANRLPADHVYTLPTLSQLERMRRSGDAPAPGVWLWTDDGFGPDPDAPSNPMPFAWQNGDPPQREPRASSRPCPGTVFRVVLTRVR